MRAASVVVVTRDRRRLLEPVLRAALADPAAAEVVVVDDGSTDGTAAALSELADPRLRVVRLGGAGAAVARRAGVEAARYGVVLLLDDDVLARPGLVAGHLAHHGPDSRLVVAGAMPVAADGDLVAGLYGRIYEDHLRLCERDPERILRNLWAGNVSLRTEHARAVPASNPALPLERHTDWEWGLRLLDAGLTGVLDRSLRAVHVYERTVAQLRRDAEGSARAAVALHRAYEPRLGPFPADGFASGPAPLRALVRAAGAPGGALPTAAARVAAQAADRAGAHRTAGRLLFAWLQMTKQRAIRGRASSAVN